MTSKWIPPTVPIPPVFTRFDDVIDQWVEEHVRSRRSLDSLMYSASALGDHGFVWLALGAVQAARAAGEGRPWKRPFVRTAAGLGIESALVNGPVKWLFRRSRPVHEGPRPRHLRQPRTSSFPSGHATAAFFGAALLRDGDDLWPLYYAIAVVVATSRLHVKIHHASDVIGGVLLGVALGEIARHVIAVDPPVRPGLESTGADGG